MAPVTCSRFFALCTFLLTAYLACLCGLYYVFSNPTKIASSYDATIMQNGLVAIEKQVTLIGVAAFCIFAGTLFYSWGRPDNPEELARRRVAEALGKEFVERIKKSEKIEAEEIVEVKPVKSDTLASHDTIHIETKPSDGVLDKPQTPIVAKEEKKTDTIALPPVILDTDILFELEPKPQDILEPINTTTGIVLGSTETVKKSPDQTLDTVDKVEKEEKVNDVTVKKTSCSCCSWASIVMATLRKEWVFVFVGFLCFTIGFFGVRTMSFIGYCILVYYFGCLLCPEVLDYLYDIFEPLIIDLSNSKSATVRSVVQYFRTLHNKHFGHLGPRLPPPPREFRKPKEKKITGMIKVQLVNCIDLVKAEILMSSDPYVVVSFHGQRQQTKPYFNSQHVTFQENPFTFNYNGMFDVHVLKLVVMDSDVVGEDNFLGQCCVDLKEFIGIGDGVNIQTFEKELENVKSGCIRFNVEFEPLEESFFTFSQYRQDNYVNL